jgi:hypothetical protein
MARVLHPPTRRGEITHAPRRYSKYEFAPGTQQGIGLRLVRGVCDSSGTLNITRVEHATRK